MVKKKKKKRKAAPRRSPRAKRRATLVKTIDAIEGRDADQVEALRLGAQAMAQMLAEENLERRDRWLNRLKEALLPCLEDLMATGARHEKQQAANLASRLVDRPGEHLWDARRAEYGCGVVQKMVDLRVAKLQAQVDTGGDEITSERWLRVLADLQPVFKEAIERQVREALQAAK
ncbi:MAG: hypothetical protein ACYS5V_12745 [Planctomycetota bacterium]|jgi:hypothetical protein